MLLDTNILIAYLNGENLAISFISELKTNRHALFISSIAVAEILSLPSLSELEIKKIKSFLKEFIIISFNEILAEKAALIKRCYGLGLPDAIIAATAINNKIVLVSRDKQFKKVKELSLLMV